MKNTTKLWLSMLAITSAMTVGCGEDPQEPPASCDPACTEDQVCENGKCVDKTPVVDVDKCKDVVCEGEQTCNKETGKCEGGDEPEKCTDGLEDCNGTCVNFMTDKTNCGGCGISCGDKECENGTCKQDEVINLCDVNEPPVCDGNFVKTCSPAGYELSDCGENAICLDGACKNYECDDTTPAYCDSNLRKFCKDKFFESEDCGSKTCEDGVCTDAVFEKECENTDAAKCDEVANAVMTCVGNKWQITNCNTLTCVEGECKEIVKTDCEVGNFTDTCADETTKRGCGEDGMFVDTPCNTGEICLEGACKSTTIEDLCPDDDTKTAPGVCGCGIPDVDLDENGVADCQDAVDSKTKVDFCPDDPNKVLPGICGCNIPDTLDANGNPLCVASLRDYCPNDERKTLPGTCGCNIPDTINEFTGLPWCVGMGKNKLPFDVCDENDNKYLHGVCGCGIEDTLGADGLTPECLPEPSEEDLCPDDDNKTNLGACGCGVEDTDSDGDGVADCLDAFPNDKYLYYKGGCNEGEIPIVLDGKNDCAVPIETAKEFNDIRKGIIDKSIKNTANEIYVLINDIDLGDVFKSSETEWSSVDNFAGKLISNGKTISYTYEGELSTLKCTASNCGLFNSLNGARIHNINFNLNVKSDKGYTGIIAGNGKNSNITKVKVSGNVTANGSFVGGALGHSSPLSASDLTHEGNVVNASGNYTGGVFGHVGTKTSVLSNIENIGDVTANGSYTGGIGGTIESGCSLTGAVSTGNIKGKSYVGGINGYDTAELSNIVSNGSVDGVRYVGGVSGQHGGNSNNITNNSSVNIYNNLVAWAVYSGGVFGYIVGGYTHENILNTGNITSGCDPYDSYNSNGVLYKEYGSCCAVGGIGGVVSNSVANGTIFKNVSNEGNITADKTASYYGGILGYGYSIDFTNVSNSGNIDGWSQAGGIVGFYDLTNDPTPRRIEFKFENVINTGKVSGSSYVAGIVGRLNLRKEGGNVKFTQIVNKGEINSNTSSYQGGIFGLVRQNGTLDISDVYSLGDVKGNNYVGGIAGILHPNDDGQFGSAKRAINTNFSKVYSKANVSGNEFIGGLFGRIYTDAYNRTSPAGVRVECPTNANAYRTQYQFTYYDLDHTINLSNSYSEGLVNGTGSYVGGLIAYVGGTSNTKSFTNTTYSFDNNCAVTTSSSPAGTVKVTGKLIVSNTYTSSSVTGVNSNTGGLIGGMSYTNSLDASANYIFNNVYATGEVQETSGALFGSNPNVNGITFKNTYWWPEAGSAKGACATSACALNGVSKFDYNAGIATLLKEDDSFGDKLADKLNSNRASSIAPELNDKISLEWITKKFKLASNTSITLPSFDFEPVDWQKELEAGRE